MVELLELLLLLFGGGTEAFIVEKFGGRNNTGRHALKVVVTIFVLVSELAAIFSWGGQRCP